MAGKNTAVFGIYRDRQHAEQAVDALRMAGFRNSDVSALLPDNVGTKDFAHEKNTKAPEGTTTGVASGGALGWLAGIGALAIPGLGPFHHGRPDYGSAGRGGCGRSGRRTGWRAGRDGYSRVRSQAVRGPDPEGGVLLSVDCDNSDRVKRTKQILEDMEAQDVSST